MRGVDRRQGADRLRALQGRSSSKRHYDKAGCQGADIPNCPVMSP